MGRIIDYVGDVLVAIGEAIWDGLTAIWSMCKKIIRATISFVKDLISGLFDILEDIFGEDNVPESVDVSPVKPFVANMDKLIASAPTSDQGLFKQKNKNYMKGVYDTRTGKIIQPTYVAGDNVDTKTREELGDEPIIIIG